MGQLRRTKIWRIRRSRKVFDREGRDSRVGLRPHGQRRQGIGREGVGYGGFVAGWNPALGVHLARGVHFRT